MDDVLRRLGLLESDVSVIKAEVAGIAAQLPHLATKAVVDRIAAQLPNLATKEDVMATKIDIMAVKAEVAGIAAQVPYLATRAEIGDLKASIIQWMVGTVIAMAALAFTIAKFVY